MNEERVKDLLKRFAVDNLKAMTKILNEGAILKPDYSVIREVKEEGKCEWFDMYGKDNKPGFVAVCESGRSDLLTYHYKTKEDAESDMVNFRERTGNKCLAIFEVNPYLPLHNSYHS